MLGTQSDAGLAIAFRRLDDVTAARTTDTSFVTALRERVGDDLRAVAEYSNGRPTVLFCRDDFYFEQSDACWLSDGRFPRSLRTDHDCAVAFEDETVWLSFDHAGGRILVALDHSPSRNLARLVRNCRTALDACDRDESLAR